MKRKIFTLILTIVTMIVSICGLFACGMVEFKVNFVVDGVVYDTINTNGEEIIKMPENPTKDEYTFDGWFWDKDTWQTPFTANSLLDAPLSSDMNVYCKWKANTVNVESVSLDQTEISLHENDVTYLTATVLPENATDTSVVWESSNSTIAIVVGGKVTALRIGSATITATTKDGGKIATCAVYVEPITVESVALNHTALSLLRGESKTLTATVLPSNATEKGVLWHSSNSSIASVESGTVKAVGYGTATITVTTVDGNKTASCQIEVIQDKITFATLAVEGETVYGKVSNATTTFSFIREITEHGNAAYQIYKEITCETLIASKSISLNIGDNTVYVLQTVGKDLKLYTVTVRRRPMYDMTFNVNGGTSVEKQVIEEDHLASEPTTTRAGYTFTGWDYDFTKPITQDTIVNVSWTANTDTPYKVEYYLQNLEDDEYTLELTENKSGTTDTTADAEIKTFAHFTHTASATDRGNIDGDGTTVLKVYYTRDKYTVTFDGNGGTLTSGSASQTVKYGGSVTAPVFIRTGYTFDGYDKTNYTDISESFTVTAKWVYYTVTTSSNDENAGTHTVFNEKKVTVGTKVSLTATTNVGYTWLGWYDGEKVVSENRAYSFTMEAKDYALTAKWKINQYTLTIVYGNGQENKIITQDYNTEIESIVNPERAYYDFLGWDKTIPQAMPAENITITAKWESIFTLSGNTITGLTAYGQANYTALNIPSKIDGATITSINSFAFEECRSLTSVVIPDSVTSIGYSAFQYCYNLTSVVIPDSVTSIGDSAFRGCGSLEEITLPFVGASKSATGYQAVFGFIFGYTTRSISSIFISETSYHYYNSSNDEYYSYYIPVSLKKVTVTGGKIGNYAFYNCSNLTSVVIGNGVTTIGAYAFAYCSNLTSVVIPDSVTGSGFYAFYGCDSLTSITIPDSVTGIGFYAFYGCDSLTSITIPDSVTRIAEYAFAWCDSLTSVYYKGTKSDWSNISIDSYNSSLTSATRYYYSESAPTTTGNYWHYDENGNIAVW